MAAPLDGIKVLDFSIAIAAPLGGAMLSDMGARVIKIERIQGEPQRLGLPAGMDDVIAEKLAKDTLDTSSWVSLNRGKEDLAIDTRDESGKEVIMKLMKDTVEVTSVVDARADRLSFVEPEFPMSSTSSGVRYGPPCTA